MTKQAKPVSGRKQEVDFINAFKKSFENPLRLLISTLIAAIPLLGDILLEGYCMQVAQKTLKGRNFLHKWSEDVFDLVKKSFGAFGISVVYVLPGMIFIVLGVGIENFDIYFSTITSVTELWAVVLSSGPVSWLGAALMLVGGYFLPSALITYAKNNNFTAGFSFRKVFSQSITQPYFVFWLAFFLINLVLGLLLSAVDLVSLSILLLLLLTLLVALVSFLVRVAYFTVFAELLKKTV